MQANPSLNWTMLEVFAVSETKLEKVCVGIRISRSLEECVTDLIFLARVRPDLAEFRDLAVLKFGVEYHANNAIGLSSF